MSIFDETPRTGLSKQEIIKSIQTTLNLGGEMMWFVTDKVNYSWADIDHDVNKFISKIESLNFNTCDIGWYFHADKKTLYEAFKVIEQ